MFGFSVFGKTFERQLGVIFSDRKQSFMSCLDKCFKANINVSEHLMGSGKAQISSRRRSVSI